MSLGVVIKGPEGVVLAADSRVTLEAKHGEAPPILVSFDNATKLLSFSEHRYVGAVTYGAALIGQRTAHSYVPEFELALSKTRGKQRITVLELAKSMSKFFMDRWQEAMPKDYDGPHMSFIVGGYDPDAAYGAVFLFEIPRQPEPQPRNAGENEFGMTWGGQLEIVSRLIHGYDPALIPILRHSLKLNEKQVSELQEMLAANLEFRIPYRVLPLQDCVDLATFLVRTTMTAQGLAIAVRGVGGPIEVAMITRTDGIRWVQRKIIHGEGG